MPQDFSSLFGVTRIEAEIGPIDILVDNAGVQRRAPLEDFAEGTRRELTRANLDSVFFVGRTVAQTMIPRRRGRIANIRSGAGERSTNSSTPRSSFAATRPLSSTDKSSMSTAASQPRSEPRFAVVVMGVAGCGKTTFGRALAEARGVPFLEGDEFHSPEARAKMSAGIALTDSDRAPWIDRIGERLADARALPEGAVVACSALRSAYRDRLRALVGPDLRFVFLEGDRALMLRRVAERRGHYMPASLVDSQFAALEPPTSEDDVVALPADASLAQAVPEALRRLAAIDESRGSPRR